MRLVKLSIQHFQCIEEANVDFGPGLNVLFGPNDLGKSSLAWAIRGVLLLQHNSAHHERFVSWYGNDQPRVALTFTDTANRFWRVTKTFGGSTGRSLLETSKDGRSFSTDVNGRQVDEKLRNLLGWGLAAPGGSGAGRGFPDSFLAQVLLSEQDNVRKVLFDTSLTKDADESGRRRLTEALGALAQDPLFKKVLDEAQEYVDRAFTKTGRKKRAAGSPFVETTERIKAMQRELEAIEAKVRDTQMAELRIAELIQQRDSTARELDTARAELTRVEAALAVATRRGELRERIALQRARLQEAASLRTEITAAEQEHHALQDRLKAGAARLEELTALVATHATALERARVQLETLLVDSAGDKARSELEDQLRSQRERLQTTLHAAERCREREAAARVVADALVDADREIERTSAAADAADEARKKAAEQQESAAAALDQAKQRLRDATSTDQAQARELRRTELENQRLARTADRNAALTVQRQLEELRQAEGRLQQMQLVRDTRASQLKEATDALSATERAVGEQDSNEKALLLLQTFAELQGVRAALVSAEAAAQQADQDRARVASLREDANRLRTEARTDLPPAARALELRRLAEDLRVAEARLGGGVSVVLRPRRELRIQTSLDGARPVSSQTDAVATFAAERSISLAIDELVDIEVSAGEQAARDAARDLRQRWNLEGDATLRTLGLNGLDELDSAIAAADAARQHADTLDRLASELEQRITERAPSDTADFHARIKELETRLGGADRTALAAYLEKLGDTWAKQLQHGLVSIEAERGKLKKTLDAQRAQLARIETQLENDDLTLATARDELARMRTKLDGDPATLASTITETLAAIERELADIDTQLATLASAANEVSVVREGVMTAEKALADAKRITDERTREAARARDALVQARAKRDAVVQRARELDIEHVWDEALQTGSTLDLASWTEAMRRAQHAHDEAARACQRLEASLQELAKTKAEAVEAARTALRAAEHRAGEAQQELSAISDANHELQQQATAKLLAIADMKTKLASLNVDDATRELTTLTDELAKIPGDDRVDEAAVERQRLATKQLEVRHTECIEDLARARGALEQVGGAIVREQKRELEQAIARETQREHELKIEYDAWKLLVDTMRDAESKEGAHLGRALAGPVTQRFRQLTRGRYGKLEFGAHLEGAGLQVNGELRDFAALSAGTQDQLATLLRLCVAEELRTAIVLDDHLSQSDPGRVSWFNSVLRAAAHKIQIIFITCRPAELLTEAELPAADEAMRISAADHVRAVDLTKVIRRFAPESPDSGLISSAPEVVEPNGPYITYDS